MTNEESRTLGRIETMVQQNAEHAKTVASKVEIIEENIYKLNKRFDDSDTELKVLRARAMGFFAAVSLGFSLLWTIFSEKITELKHFLFG